MKEGDRRKPVAEYVKDRDDDAPDGTTWEQWLQANRIELNAMTTPQFITWLDAKMAEHGVGKLIPPQAVVAAELENFVESKLRGAITARILREAGLDRQVEEALDRIAQPTGPTLTKGIAALFAEHQHRPWRDHIADVAAALTASESR